ncbi:MAG: OmpA family protein [Candidatus Kapabacteria bacterium]|nr:OmpA family protein [Candidatus Kapabacteria bacterium]
MKRIVLMIFVSCLAVPSACAQIGGQEAWRFGLTGSATLNMHDGPLTTYDGLQECGTFTSTNTIGWTVGNMAWYRLAPDVAASARLQYWSADGTFTSPNPVQPLVSLGNGTTVPLSTEYDLSTSLDYITLDLIAQWYPIKNFYVGLGPQIGIATQTSFEQSERIVQPAFMEFVNGGTERTIYAADFTNSAVSSNIRVAAVAVVGYDIYAAERFVITPEVSYLYAFTNVLSSSPWSVNALRAGVHLSYAFGLPEAIVAPIEATAAVVAPAVVEAARPMPSVLIDLESTMADGSTIAGGDVLITEQRSSDVVPLLPFVFFDVKSSVIPDRYAKNKQSDFDESTIRDSVLGIYHQLLNIVGARLAKYPDARLTVGGYRDPSDGENTNVLSTSRAEAVKTYLTSVWNIAPSRIDTKQGALPNIVSNQGIADGRTENRRAELTSNDPRILAPVNRVERISTIEPRTVHVVSTVTDRAEVTKFAGSVVGDNGVMLASLSDDSRGFVWQPQASSLQKLLGDRRSARSSAQVTITNGEGIQRTAQAPFTIRREVRSTRYSNEVVNDSIIERFRLIFFDYDAATVSAFNVSMVDLVRSRIRTTSSIRITGLTDRIGPSQHNTELSLARAQAIDASIKQRIVAERVTVKGAGPELIYNNDLPEGRWYNRTVLIEVATPVDAE